MFRSVRRRGRREREGREGREEEEVKRQKLEDKREAPPVVMLTGINQSIAKKLKTVYKKSTLLCVAVHVTTSTCYISLSLCRSSRGWGEE